MVSIKELCQEFRMSQGIDTEGEKCGAVNLKFADVIDISPNKPQLICVGSRPGMGRTAFCIDLILKTALTEGKTVLFFLGGTAFEENTSLLLDRLLRRLCGANEYSVIKNVPPQVIAENTKSVPFALKLLEKLNIYFDIHKFSTVDYVRECVLSHENVGLVVVGNIEFIIPDTANPKEAYRAVNGMIDRLSFLAKELKIPLVMTTTLSRSVELQENKRPNIRHLKLMRLRRMSDTVVLLYREAYYTLDKDDKSAAMLIAKTANGNTGWKKMKFDYNKIKFAEV